MLKEGETALATLKLEVQNNIAKLKPLSETEIKNHKKELETLGLTKENIYLFAQGHTIYNNVVCMFLKPVEAHLRKEHFGQIEKQAKNNKNTEETKEEQVLREKKEKQIIKDNKKEYRNSTTDIKQALRLNTNYDACFLMLKIDTDVEKFKNSYEKK